MTATKQNPYVGPRKFETHESHLFFGREREALDLVSLVISERLVLFYAQSGAGKSSLVSTRLIPGLLDEMEYKVFPVGRVGGGEASSNSDVNNIYVFNLINSLTQRAIDREVLSKLTIAKFLAGLEVDGEGYTYSESPSRSIFEDDENAAWKQVLIIDQFEELFSTHQEAWEKRADFFKQLAQAMDEFPNLWVVLVMREDFIAYLDPYVNLLPGKLRVRYYMQRLERDAALKAIKKPVEHIRPFAEEIAEKLADDLSSIKVQRPGGAVDRQPGQYIEPVQLQVVCYGLWGNLPPNGTQITEKDLQEVGNVNQSLEKHYAKRVKEVAEQKGVGELIIREWFEKELITSSGMRNMVLQETRKRDGELEDDVIRALQSDLVRAEKRGENTFYELTHDRLVEPILANNKKWKDENASFLQRGAALWDERGRSEGLLMRRQELRDAESWAETNSSQLTGLEKIYLEACCKARAAAQAQALANQRVRSALRTSVIIAGVAVFLLVVSIFLGIQSYRNQRNTQTQVLINASSIELNKGNMELAALLGYQALINYGDHGEAEQALGNIVRPIEKKETIKAPFELATGALPYVCSITASPDGKILASGYSDGVIILWNLQNYQIISKLPAGHYNYITSMVFSPDGRTLVSASKDAAIILWDVSDPTQPLRLATLEGHTDIVNTVAVSPDGRTLVSASYDRKIILWDISDPSRPSKLVTLSGHGDVVWGVAFSPDGKTLASGSWDDSVIMWDISDLKKPSMIATLKGHTADVESVAFSPDGKTLASVSDDLTIILWDVSTLRPIGQPLTGHKKYVRYLAFSPDGRTLVSSSDDSAIILWDLTTRQPLGQPLSGYGNVVFSLDGKTLFLGDGDGVAPWDVNNPTKPIRLARFGKYVSDVTVTSVKFMSLTPGGKALAIIRQDDSIVLADIESGQTINQIAMPDGMGAPTWITLSSDKQLVASMLGIDIYVWAATTGKVIVRIEGLPTTWTTSAAFSPDNKYVVSGTYDGDVCVWEIATGKEIVRMKRGAEPVTSVVFSPDGKYVASASYGDGTIYVWEVASGKEINRIAHDRGVISVTFGPDGTRVALALDDGNGTVEIWDLQSRQAILAISNGRLKPLSYSVAGWNNLPRSDQNEPQENKPQESTAYIANVLYLQEGLFIFYKNGVVDRWDIWPSRAELLKYARSVCQDCELNYSQRVEYELYNWPMQAFNYSAYLIMIVALLIYGLSLRIVQHAVFAEPGERNVTQGFSWKKFLSASAQGVTLVFISLVSFSVILSIEILYFGATVSKRMPSTGILWLLLLLNLPLGFWAGGAYSHFTWAQSGKWSRTKRSLIGILSGLLGGLLAGPAALLTFAYLTGQVTSFFASIGWAGLGITGLITGGAMGLMSLFGALLYIFWLYPWSERRRQRQQEEDF